MTGLQFTAVAPDSLRFWYHAFADSAEPVVFLGEEPNCTALAADELVALAAGAEIRLFSSHDTLRRDLVFAESCREAGGVVRSQSAVAVRAAVDKVFAKQLLEQHGLPVPCWGVHAPAEPEIPRLLRKRRDSTQSKGLTWAAEATEWRDDVYWEQYVHGIEYSVVLYREGNHITVLPPVWKGSTRYDLMPPWRRLRVCPVPSGKADVVAMLVELSRHAANALEVWGFMEAEFIVTDEQPYIVEVNPRICGTMRLAAMAAGIPIFDGKRLYQSGVLPPAVAYAAELPYSGLPVVKPHVIATSRVTCAAPTASEARELLEAHAAVDVIRSAQWPQGW
jgi:biotin carboxylase